MKLRSSVKVGELIQFMMIGAGKTDNPPYSEDGSWRVGILLGYENHTILEREHVGKIFYRNKVMYCRVEQMRPL